MQHVLLRDLGTMGYLSAWNFQESLLQQNVRVKLAAAKRQDAGNAVDDAHILSPEAISTVNHLLLVEHPPVYTLGKSGFAGNLLLSEEDMQLKEIEFFRTNRGGDITFHGPGQLVGYPVLDLEKFYTDIGRYLRDLEEVIIKTISAYGLKGERSEGETGVWLDPAVPGRARKICAMGVRCSRWITMHGFALNINTDLGYFENIIPCGIHGKQVTSLQKEIGKVIPMQEVKEKLLMNFSEVFNVTLVGCE